MSDSPSQAQDSSTPGWKPTRSTVVGAVVGGALAQLIVKIAGYFFGTIDPVTVGSVNTLCIAGVGYFFIDGGRK